MGQTIWPAVVAQLVEDLPPKPKVQGSRPVIGKTSFTLSKGRNLSATDNFC